MSARRPRSRRALPGATLFAVLLALFSMALPGSGRAHELTMAEMHMRELGYGQFMMSWAPGGLGAEPALELSPVWPQGCGFDETLGVLACQDGLKGTVKVEGIGDSYSAAIFRITWLDGQRRVYTFTKSQPSVHFYGSADDLRKWSEIVPSYIGLGVEHILQGIDHLAFVLCLLFLVGFNRQLLWTVTAFTAAHSITLGLSAINLITLSGPPVEATIALSIVLAASEALRKTPTATRRWPALVAFIFGLVHGLGFAGALREIGLPEHHLLLALLSFNVGVEIGQLVVVAIALGLWLALRNSAMAAFVRTPAIYIIGTGGAYWSWERVTAMVMT